MCSIDLDPCDVWRETPRIARKAHQCDGCGSTIAPSEPHLQHFSVFEGDASHQRMCFPCWWDREVFSDAHGQSFMPSCLGQMLADCVGGEWGPMLDAFNLRARAAYEARR